MIDYNILIGFLPEFTTTDSDRLAVIGAAIKTTDALNNGFLGLGQSVRPYALALATASYLVTDGYKADNNLPVAPIGSKVSRIKSYDDEIHYETSDQIAANKYQVLLERLLMNYSVPSIARNNPIRCSHYYPDGYPTW